MQWLHIAMSVLIFQVPGPEASGRGLMHLGAIDFEALWCYKFFIFPSEYYTALYNHIFSKEVRMSTHSQESRSDPRQTPFSIAMQELRNEKCPRSRHKKLYELLDLFTKPEELVELYNAFPSVGPRDIIVRVIRSWVKVSKSFETKHFNPMCFRHWSQVNAYCVTRTSKTKVDPMELFSLHMMLMSAKRIRELANLFHSLPATRHSSVYDIRQKVIARIVSYICAYESSPEEMRTIRSCFQEEEWKIFEQYRKAA
jgi:hypothetical protein